MSLRTRIALAGGAVVMAALLAASLILYGALDTNLHDQLDTSLVHGAASATDVLRQLKRQDKGSGTHEPVKVGGTVVQFIPQPIWPGPTRDFIPLTERDVRVSQFNEPPYFQDLDGMRVYTTVVPNTDGMLVRVARPLSDATETLRWIAVLLAALTIGGGLTAGTLSRLAAGRLLRPVGRLTDLVEHVRATHRLDARLEVAGRDEIGRLAIAFNGMLAALETSVEAQHRLVGDASHELRTPLTSLTTDLDLLAETDADPELVSGARRQAGRLNALIRDLLDLARAGTGPARTEDLRLDLIARSAAAHIARRAEGVHFELDTKETYVHGDPDAVERAIGNLIDNAAKWSPPGGRVHVEVREGQVDVRDEGPGIDAADLPYVFDRFYRSAAGRSREGAGLGLAIVRQIAQTHHGVVEVVPAKRGAHLRLSLPAII
ncbi:two-component sensor histidine kinase [Acrocarpospora corrugata]|uniref:histidine kinase n=1 Tax=Acrocarpospora corrugata TaxID=35763 RepID=A0A5M3W335_9ACTN|nr:HAMP domain-containing sensor histidine kinase [Acrocarpospora corrugata]GES02689.1 two-component sensor histidine kinase [Acrocarpospora corrugata]